LSLALASLLLDQEKLLIRQSQFVRGSIEPADASALRASCQFQPREFIAADASINCRLAASLWSPPPNRFQLLNQPEEDNDKEDRSHEYGKQGNLANISHG